ncbi:diguanylate cyclase domain-containing protein [Chryseomicrobium palamuruense]|uniref:Diguanylate cyclase domain-containing protein n=1 Tax=Chryseomicrobium palamuruense TaxID=682973 RepID=A0ABV8UTV9_9BACL
MEDVHEADRQTAERRVSGLMKEQGKSYSVEGQMAMVGISAGGRLWTGEDSLEDVLAQADSALYDVKMNGKKGIKFYN